MITIMCPNCGASNKIGTDEYPNCEVCKKCGCNYGEIEDEQSEIGLDPDLDSLN